MNKHFVWWFLTLVFLGVPGSICAQSDDVTALRQRITELEQQNKQIMEMLAGLSAEIKKKEAAKETPAAPPATLITEGNKSELSFYGFARMDMIYDDSRTNAAQTPTYILSEPANALNDDNFTMHPRLSRFGMNFKGPVIDMLGGAKLSAKAEIDFHNGGSESRAIPRYRHVYAKLDWEHSSLLLGQTSDIISPLFPSANADTLMWYAGNLGDRRVQLRYTYTPNSSFSIAAGLGLTGAVNLQDLDNNGIRDGEDSGLPHFQGRVGYKSDLFDLGVWGHIASESTKTAFNGKTDFEAHSIGLDFTVRPFKKFSVKGEFWTGAGLGDVRGGIGQSINTTTGSVIDATGGWIEAGYQATSIYTISGGWTYDDPDNNDLSNGARKLNRAWYLTNQFRLHPAFMVGVDYIHWTTDYTGLPQGTDNRYYFYGVYNF